MSHRITAVLLTVAGLLLSGCNSAGTQNNDPLIGMNKVFYNFNDGLDKHLMQPVARGYVKVTPKFFRTGVGNFFSNISYPNVILNDILQGKFKQAWDDFGRLITNTTVGLGGLFDPASGSGLIKHDEDLGQTFGKWGMGEGAYLVLPLRGPNSLRDAPDLVTSTLLSPLYYAGFPIAFPLGALNAINTRAEFLDATRLRDEAALDAYAFTREAYRQNRNFKIADGNVPNPPEEEYLQEGESGVLKVF